MTAPRTFRAPGRVNLIGEHTDYNGGFVLPVALELECRVTASPGHSAALQVRSRNLGEVRCWRLGTVPEKEQPVNHAGAADWHRRGDWSDYVAGVAVELVKLGVAIPPAELEIDSSVPIGAGLSSSAALEVAAALALCALAGARLEPADVAQACLRAENDFVGMKCGIMDQFIAALGRQGHALLIDCRSLDHRAVPLPAGCDLVMVNTMVRHELASSEYNRRREECERAAGILGHSLRDAALAETSRLPETERRRARHVISENGRVERFIDACESGNLTRAGELMYESHASLRNDYEVSCPELDFLVDAASKFEGIVGARMTGGGFGGSTVNLVRSGSVAEFHRRIAAAYREAFGVTPDVYSCRTAGGASEVAPATPR